MGEAASAYSFLSLKLPSWYGIEAIPGGERTKCTVMPCVWPTLITYVYRQ